MVDLKSIESEYSEDIDAVSEWCDSIYSSIFAPFFANQHDLFKRMQSKQHPITDEELEHILVDIPVNLFELSEKLNSFRLKQEVLKMKTKQKKSDIIKNSSESTDTKRKEEAALRVLEDELLITSYSSVITRVENEISFSRELIMGAKKIWDGRRNGDISNPVGEVDARSSNTSYTDPELPAYRSNNTPRAYIR